jgi:uncharacterized membrane protein YuzA (DUF378 family)
MFKNACWICKIVGALVIIGAINWGLIGVFHYNVVDHFFGVGSVVSRVIYTVVGLSGLALLTSYFWECPKCRKGPEV